MSVERQLNIAGCISALMCIATVLRHDSVLLALPAFVSMLACFFWAGRFHVKHCEGCDRCEHMYRKEATDA